MDVLLYFISGFGLGILIMIVINSIRLRDTKKIAEELVRKTEAQKIQDLEILINRMKESFGSVSFEALSKSSQELLKLANETFSKQNELGQKELENKKKLIDQTLELIKLDLKKVQDLVVQYEKDREQKFGQLATQLRLTAEQTSKLQETTNKLYSALASTKVRGQWGERMAEDILRFAGFKENVNYVKQKVIDSSNKRPDYTFLLPQNMKLNMDVKFPLDNYLKYLEVQDENQKEEIKKQFLKDVRSRIKEVTTRDYINPEQNTLDYVLVFIPNEQIFNFIIENDITIIDDAIQNKVVLCSPNSLYAILSVIRQAIDNFKIERTASEIIALLGSFYKHWSEFINSLEKVGKKIKDAYDEYEFLINKKKRNLEKSLDKIEDLRNEKNIEIEQRDYIEDNN